jgi:hypothetical protein
MAIIRMPNMFREGVDPVERSMKVSQVELMQKQKGATAVNTALNALKLGDAVMESKPINALADEVGSWFRPDVEMPGKAISEARAAGKPLPIKPTVADYDDEPTTMARPDRKTAAKALVDPRVGKPARVGAAGMMARHMGAQKDFQQELRDVGAGGKSLYRHDRFAPEPETGKVNFFPQKRLERDVGVVHSMADLDKVAKQLFNAELGVEDIQALGYNEEEFAYIQQRLGRARADMAANTAKTLARLGADAAEAAEAAEMVSAVPDEQKAQVQGQIVAAQIMGEPLAEGVTLPPPTPAKGTLGSALSEPDEMRRVTSRQRDARDVANRFADRAYEMASAEGSPVPRRPSSKEEAILATAQKMAKQNMEPFPSVARLKAMPVAGLIAQAEVRGLTQAQLAELDYFVTLAARPDGIRDLAGKKYVEKARKMLYEAYTRGSKRTEAMTNPMAIAKKLMELHLKGAKVRDLSSRVDARDIRAFWDGAEAKATTARTYADLLSRPGYRKFMTKRNVARTGQMVPMADAILDNWNFQVPINDNKVPYTKNGDVNDKMLNELLKLQRTGTQRQRNAAKATLREIRETYKILDASNRTTALLDKYETDGQLAQARIDELDAKAEKARRTSPKKSREMRKDKARLEDLQRQLEIQESMLGKLKPGNRDRDAALAREKKMKQIAADMLELRTKDYDDEPEETAPRRASSTRNKKATNNIRINPATGKEWTLDQFLAASLTESQFDKIQQAMGFK